ncbi:MAG: PilZ domain-containing protein [Magnetococcales bacterium]|nr:PilZ domain-containing protein [Magnetococcales bacterium]MBF0116238.1 PilZ domain-containing protein [Magnetococcales bacterium]
MMMQPRAQRIQLHARVLLELTGKGALTGNTLNVSGSGVLFTVGYPAKQLAVGEVGLLHVLPLDGNQPLPCKVTRVSEFDIAVQFLENCPDGTFSRLVLVGKQ